MNRRQRKKQLKMKNKKLVKRYPWLLPKNVWTDKLDKDYDYTYTLADCFPEGWRKAFFEEMHEELREELIKYNYLDEFRVMQIKEKYGMLRYYVGSTPKDSKIHDIIDKYEYISQFICLDCGKLDVPVIDDGWLTPICESCYNKRKNRQKQWYESHGYKYNEDFVPTYEKLLENVDYDYTLKDYYKIERSSPGSDWETITIDISDTVEKLRKKG